MIHYQFCRIFDVLQKDNKSILLKFKTEGAMKLA